MRRIKERKYIFDLSIDAWVNSIEIEAESYDDALEELYQLTLEELIEKGYVKGFDIKNIEYDVEGDIVVLLNGDDLKELILKRIPEYIKDDEITDLDDLLDKFEDESRDENIEFSWIEAQEMIKAYLEEHK